MRIDVVTLFPEMVDIPLSDSIVGRARKEGRLKLGFANPRDFSEDRRGTVDDKPYGGGTGMVMMAEPVYKALKRVKKKGSHVIVLTPKGGKLDQKTALELATHKHLVLICGHYEGIDERINRFADLELSIGDYVLTGGEPAAVVIIDAVTRLLPGVLKKEDATINETFAEGLLEAPHYTRPGVWRRMKVPEVLLSGNHKLISEWRFSAAKDLTAKRRPDLIRKAKLEEV
ncbi:MAG: tRNA (guanosine(37)-N1)-methyltransferase TrmD [Elusimicrobia bacterium RIFOXYA12_FULL_51_18]|nr:MAG: tRNA (guanosine(37)-N1)-methyltransferase TrmD [Elusimicrobia bacterium RIFOXYA12_FULL_51_18]OGS28777.1 MAG: tRNA (guanosine(37)-N1)-methyltransferase TrmD [Elusimicrobia bacterium RIFOXYA2_FULL_53_38]